MDAVGKLNLLEVGLESLEVLVIFVTLIVGVDPFDEVADCKVVFAVLVPQYITTCDSRLGEIVDVDALTGSELFEIGHLIAEHLDVGKSVSRVVEIVGIGFLVRCARSCDGESCHSRNEEFVKRHL